MIINILCITSIVLNIMSICFYGFLYLSAYKKNKIVKNSNKKR